MFNKTKKDILYKNIINKYKICNQEYIKQKLIDSGYIFEKRTCIDDKIINDLNFPTLNISDIDVNVENPALIITTGSFSPIHDGHINSLKIAKEYVESIGFNVVKGIISLSHDGYVDYKNNGQAKLNCSIRTDLVYRKLYELNEKWISVDKLEGEMVSIPINFSTVIERIKKYIEYNLNIDNLKVFYVFGSDNIGFFDAFINNDTYHAICINRNNDNFFSYHQKENNFHYLENNEKTKFLSSTFIRNNKKHYSVNKNSDKKIFMIRGDGSDHNFNLKLKSVFEKYFDNNIEVRLFYTYNYKYNKENTISIDKHIDGKYKLDISRQFNICDSNIIPNKLIFKDIDVNIDNTIEYVLLDDDSVSGYTIENANKILSDKNIKIKKYDFILNSYLKNNEILYDVVDAIDFVLFSNKGGLVVNFKNNDIRVPYLFPFVNLTYRSSISPEDQISFSRDVININDDKVTKNNFYHFVAKENNYKDYLLDIYNNYLEAL